MAVKLMYCYIINIDLELQFPHCGKINILLLLLLPPKSGFDIDCNGTATVNDTAWWWFF